jgi:DNA-binding transcriptional ArsR family regulator
MGELVVGRPVLKHLFVVSAPLVLTSAISLTFRAAAANGDDPPPGFDPWLIDARRSLDAGLRHDLDLLLGFSGRLIYYIEELLFSFDALEPDRIDASYDEYLAHLESLPATAYQRMASNALMRVYRDRGVVETPPDNDDPAEWRMFLRPGITRADLDEAASLLTSPAHLRERTIALVDRFWQQCYRHEYERQYDDLQRAVRHAQAAAHPVVQIAFAELTGHRLPNEVVAALPDVERVTYCPSPNLGEFVQFILYAPELILFFNPKTVLGASDQVRRRVPQILSDVLEDSDALGALKALADPSRMRIVRMLGERELYAQEIVGQLGISQSAVSRHLGTLESAGIVTVRPVQGMKYYAIDRAFLRSLGAYVDGLAEVVATE